MIFRRPGIVVKFTSPPRSKGAGLPFLLAPLSLVMFLAFSPSPAYSFPVLRTIFPHNCLKNFCRLSPACVFELLRFSIPFLLCHESLALFGPSFPKTDLVTPLSIPPLSFSFYASCCLVSTLYIQFLLSPPALLRFEARRFFYSWASHGVLTIPQVFFCVPPFFSLNRLAPSRVEICSF